jgi:phosphate transport system protein
MTGALEPRHGFEAQLREISDGIVQMAALVIEGIDRSTQVLLNADVVGAAVIISDDDEVDLLQTDVEEAIGRSFALQQPVASDLRLLIASLKMTGDMERSGDLVVNIAKGTIRLGNIELDPFLRGLIDEMRKQAVLLFGTCIDAYVWRDEVLAGSVPGLDDVLDDLHREFISAVFASHTAGRLDVQQAVQLCLQGRFYERLGDHAVNVARRTEYLVTGWLPEHAGAERARQRGTR